MKGRMKALPLHRVDHDYSKLGPFEIIDDKGPFSVRSINNYIRFDLFSWRSSRWLEVKFKKTKNDFFQHLKDVIVHKEVRGQKVLRMQTDSDYLLYDNAEVRQWLTERGIELSMSSPYVHAQNGWIERDMQSILDIARTIMMPYQTPLVFWDFAIQHAVYIKNRSPHEALHGKTPYQMVYDHPPDISNLIPFFCPGLYHLTKEERSGTLAVKAVECRLLGYDDQDIKLIYVPTKKMVIRRRDCIFDES